ncbi:hypothetical protein [Caldivirga sp. UBA161]|nr:hypothetical protein [Caldivirga sp. UBA161]
MIPKAAAVLDYEANTFTGWAMFKLLKNPTPLFRLSRRLNTRQ